MRSRFNRIMRLGVACVTAFMLVSVGLMALRAERVEARAATTLMVTSTNDSGPGSLRSTIGLAQAGDTIQFNLAANSTIILTSSEVIVTVPITIDGSTATNLTLSGNQTNRVLAASAPLSVRSLTIANGTSNGMGGGIDTTSVLTLSAVVSAATWRIVRAARFMPWAQSASAAASFRAITAPMDWAAALPHWARSTSQAHSSSAIRP